MTAPKSSTEADWWQGVRPVVIPIVAVFRSRLPPMFAGCGVGVLSEDMAEVRIRGNATRDSDILKLTVQTGRW
jgi:hypothetical protein